LTIKALFETLTEGIVVVDEQGTIVLINQRIEELFGYSQEEVLGRSLGVFLPQRFADSHVAHINVYFQKPWHRQMGQGMDLIGRRKDGSEFFVEIGLSYLDTDEGKLAIALVTDISRRKAIEQELRERNEELDAFAHTVAHDLNASMSLVVGYSDTLAAIHQTLSPEELHEYLMLIARNGRKMSNIINELLLFASMRRKDIPFKPLNMAAIVEEALRRLDYEVQTVEAEIIKPESFPRAVGHAAWVEEVWFNYISNGLKYGGRPPRLELGSTILGDGTIQFWVQDNGGGLSESQQGVVFTPPSQTGILRVQGHGLGLSIVRRIVDKLNGRVFVESQMEKGSRFGFILPASPEEPDTSEPDS
jgi:PAS domain S-box-containing protein